MAASVEDAHGSSRNRMQTWTPAPAPAWSAMWSWPSFSLRPRWWSPGTSCSPAPAWGLTGICRVRFSAPPL